MTETKQIGQGVFVRNPNSNPPKVRKILETIGSEPITSLQLVRTPLASSTRFLLNIASFGQLEKKLKTANIDKLFHLALFINGKYILEKNNVIELRKGNPVTKGSETLDIPVKKDLDINTLLEKTRARMGDSYAPYDGIENNCSVFVDNVLIANGLQNSEGSKFVKQKTVELFQSFPSLTKFITRLATATGAAADRAISGEGKRDAMNYNHALSQIKMLR